MSEFSFVVMTDSHVDVCGEDGYWWNRCLYSRSSQILTAAVQEINIRAPDFVVHCGDLTNDSAAENFREAARLLGGLTAPLYYVPGNHDAYTCDSRAVAATALGLGEPCLHRAAYVKGWRLIFVDSAYWLYDDGSFREYLDWDAYRAGKVLALGPSDEELAWLSSVFARDDKTPSLCFMHLPMAFRDHYPVSRMPKGKQVETQPVTFPLKSCAKRLKTLLAEQLCVKAIFCGHGHFHDWIREDGRVFCQTASLIEHPNEVRLVRVSPGRIETSVFGIPTGDYAALSYVEEWGNTWVAGRPIDRAASAGF